MVIKAYSHLPEQAKYIRETVFVKEQKFQEEFDSIDNEATHLVAFDGEKPVGTGRFFINEGTNDYLIGRIAVLKEYRGKGIGGEIIAEAEKIIKEKGGNSVSLHSQLQAQPFYEKQGYKPFGEIGYEEYCPHIWMKKELK